MSLPARALAGVLEQGHQREHQQEDDDPQGEISKIRVHRSGYPRGEVA
jgi:hypothetical protein